MCHGAKITSAIMLKVCFAARGVLVRLTKFILENRDSRIRKVIPVWSILNFLKNS